MLQLLATQLTMTTDEIDATDSNHTSGDAETPSQNRGEFATKNTTCSLEDLWATVWKHRFNKSLDKTTVAAAIRNHANLHSSKKLSNHGKWVDAFDFYRNSTPMWGPRDPSGLLNQHCLLQRSLHDSTSRPPIPNIPSLPTTSLGSRKHPLVTPPTCDQHEVPSRSTSRASPHSQIATKRKSTSGTRSNVAANDGISHRKKLKLVVPLDVITGEAHHGTSSTATRSNPACNTSGSLHYQAHKHAAHGNLPLLHAPPTDKSVSEDNFRAPLDKHPIRTAIISERQESAVDVVKHGTNKEHNAPTTPVATVTSGKRKTKLSQETVPPVGDVDRHDSRRHHGKSNTGNATATDGKRATKPRAENTSVDEEVLDGEIFELATSKKDPSSITNEGMEQNRDIEASSRLWPRALSALTIPGMRRTCKITKDTYTRFLNYPDTLHDEV